MKTHEQEVELWATGLIQRAITAHGGPLPRYGTPEWGHLPAEQRWASVLIAAECWRRDSDPAAIAEQAGAELEHQRWLAKQAEDDQYRQASAHHREMWSDATKRRAVIAAEVETDYQAWIKQGAA